MSTFNQVLDLVQKGSFAMLSAYLQQLPADKEAAFSPLNFLHCMVAGVSASLPGNAGHDALRSACQLNEDFIQNGDFGVFLSRMKKDPAISAAAALFARPRLTVGGPGADLALKATGATPKPLNSADDVNSFISKATKGLIPKILDSLDASIVTVIASALYFKGSWAFPFPKALTRPQAFHGREELSVNMMHLEKSLAYAQGSGFRAVVANFGSSKVQGWFILPNEGVIDNAGIIKATQKALSASPRNRQVELSVPRFELDVSVSSSECRQLLFAAGAGPIYDTFDLSPSLQPAEEAATLCIDAVIHKVVVKVDEEGAEAAAATVMMSRRCCVVPRRETPVVFTCDRPFGFALTWAGVPLFVTAVQKPEIA